MPFDQLAEAVLPFTRDESATIEAEKPEGRVIPFEGGEAEGQARRFSFETLHWDRVTDMRKLREQRVTIAEGGRETSLGMPTFPRKSESESPNSNSRLCFCVASVHAQTNNSRGMLP